MGLIIARDHISASMKLIKITDQSAPRNLEAEGHVSKKLKAAAPVIIKESVKE
jgi:hypothetical protein